MKITSASFETVIWRFYFMMAIVLASFFLGHPAFAVVAVPVFLSALTGVSFKNGKKKTKYRRKQLNLNVTLSRSNAA